MPPVRNKRLREGKPPKKSSSTNCQAIKEKIIFLTLFFILLPFKNKIILLSPFIEIWTYHIEVCR